MGRQVTCVKTFYDYVCDDNLKDNGIDPINYEGGIYPLFEKGKKYYMVGPMSAMSGNIISYVDSDLVLKHNNKKICNLFYINKSNWRDVDRNNKPLISDYFE